jgi:hypothetical protein
VLAQKNQPHKIRLLNPLTKTSNTIFQAQMPSVIPESVTVMKSLTIVIKAIGNNEERKEITARRHKILTWKTLSNKER